MRKINLENYLIEGFDEKGKTRKFPYNVKESLVSILFHRNLNLNAMDLLDRDDLARKIRDCKNKEILFEESEFEKIKQSINSFTGYGRNDIEFVNRILKCPKIEVEEKRK